MSKYIPTCDCWVFYIEPTNNFDLSEYRFILHSENDADIVIGDKKWDGDWNKFCPNCSKEAKKDE